MNTKIQPVFLAILYREQWMLNDPRPMNSVIFRDTHIASRDTNEQYGYWAIYFHDKEQMINPAIIKDRVMDKKNWKAKYSNLRWNERQYREHCEKYDHDGMG